MVIKYKRDNSKMGNYMDLPESFMATKITMKVGIITIRNRDTVNISTNQVIIMLDTGKMV